MTSTAIVTGATGYIGSHLVARILQTEPRKTVLCLARRNEIASAEERIYKALKRACHDQGKGEMPDDWRSRIQVWEQNLSVSEGEHEADLGQLPDLRAHEFWHCAASIKFTETSDRMVWTMNVDGLGRALELARRLGAGVFNHVSTAYVAGTSTGIIREELPATPGDFNNSYEESKSHGERLVQQFCQTHGIAYRILRPSIVVGHSRTFRTSSNAGIYRVVEQTRKFHAIVTGRTPNYFDRHPLRLTIAPEGTINTVPVDFVVAEMLDLSGRGADTLDQVFHLTSALPHNSLEALTALMGMLGIPQVEPAAEADLNTIDRLYSRGLRAYAPYLNGRQVFDRSNVRRWGADRHQGNFGADVATLGLFARSYLDMLAQQQHLPELVGG